MNSGNDVTVLYLDTGSKKKNKSNQKNDKPIKLNTSKRRNRQKVYWQKPLELVDDEREPEKKKKACTCLAVTNNLKREHDILYCASLIKEPEECDGNCDCEDAYRQQRREHELSGLDMDAFRFINPRYHMRIFLEEALTCGIVIFLVLVCMLYQNLCQMFNEIFAPNSQ